MPNSCKGQAEKAVNFPNEIWFPIGGERVTCHESELTDSLGKCNFNFRLARDQVVLLETAANSCATRPQANQCSHCLLILIWEV